MAARKLPKKRLVKYVNIKIGHRLLVHIMFKVSRNDICICNYSTLFNVFIEHVNNSTRWDNTLYCTYMLIHKG